MKRSICLIIAISMMVGLPLVSAKDFVKESQKELLNGLRARDEAAVKKTIKSLVGFGGKKSAKLLLALVKRFPAGEEKFYWLLVHGATSFQDPAALGELEKFIIKNRRRGVSRDLMFALSHNPSPKVLPILEAVLDRGGYDLQLMAVDQLGGISTTKTVDILIAHWKSVKGKKDTSTIVDRIVRVLTSLTKQPLGKSYENWRDWWKVNRSRGLSANTGSSQGGGTVVAGMSRHRGSEYGELRTLPKERILVITGSKCATAGVDHNFDHIEHTLTDLKIPHRTATKKEFNDPKFSLKGVMVIMINCSLSWDHCVCPTCKAGGTQSNRLMQCTGCDKHINERDDIKQGGIQKLKTFVEYGGYLFTEDWVLKEVLAKAWPKYVRNGKPVTKEQVVDISPARFRSSHSYLRGIFGYKKKDEKNSGATGKSTVLRAAEDALKKVNHTWKVDSESPTIKVMNKYKVTKLLVSQKLRKMSKGNDCMAVTFGVARRSNRQLTGRNYGEVSEMRGGRVLHVISHFGKQKSADDEHTLQNLMLNFVIEAKKRWDHRQK